MREALRHALGKRRAKRDRVKCRQRNGNHHRRGVPGVLIGCHHDSVGVVVDAPHRRAAPQGAPKLTCEPVGERTGARRDHVFLGGQQREEPAHRLCLLHEVEERDAVEARAETRRQDLLRPGPHGARPRGCPKPLFHRLASERGHVLGGERGTQQPRDPEGEPEHAHKRNRPRPRKADHVRPSESVRASEGATGVVLRHKLEPKLVRKRVHAMLPTAEPLRAEVDAGAVCERSGVHAPTRPFARLEHDHVATGLLHARCRPQAGQARTHNQNIGRELRHAAAIRSESEEGPGPRTGISQNVSEPLMKDEHRRACLQPRVDTHSSARATR